MSKFSKAIEKIEDLRRAERSRPPESDQGVPSLHLPPDVTEAKPTWDRTIRSLRNAKPDNRIVVYNFPDSVLSEQYRMLRTNLKIDLAQKGAQVVLVSSSIWGEGKSVTAANLAMVLSEEKDVKVALIDADLRRGRIADYLGFGKKTGGLSKFLAEEIDPRDVMIRNSRENLSVMPSGENMKNPSSLINSAKFRILIAELRNHFDYVIIDSPPIMSVADAAMMSRFADGVLFVIQIGRTPKSIIAHANLLFKQAGAKMLGYVLTNVEFHSSEYRYYDGYAYYEYDAKGNPDEAAKKKKRRMQMEKASRKIQNAEEKFTSWWKKIARGTRKEWLGT